MNQNRKEQMAREEDERFAEVRSLIERLSLDQMLEPRINPDGWSVKDLLWHLAAWDAEAAREFERIRMGTYAERDYDTDEVNARYMETGRPMDLPTVQAEWMASRNRMLKEWDALPEPTSEAIEWFYESGAEHMDDHLPELRDWVNDQA